jgi:hypothetical protein
MSNGEKARRLPILAAQLLEQERIEESLIEQSDNVQRRPDANPLAILGVQLRSAAQAA